MTDLAGEDSGEYSCLLLTVEGGEVDKETGLVTLQVFEDCQDYMRMIIGEDGEGDWHVMTIIIALIRSQWRSIKVGLDFFLPIKLLLQSFQPNHES